MDKLHSYFRKTARSPALAAFLFSLFLTIAEAYVFRQDYLAVFRANADARDFLYIVLAFAALVFFVRSMLVSRFRWQCAYFGVFAFALAVEYGFQGALGRFTRPNDFENALYASDGSDKFGAITLFFSWLVVAPLVAFRCLFRFAPPDVQGGARLFAANLLILFGGFLFFADFYRPPLPINAFSAHFDNLTTSALYVGEMKFARPPRETLPPLETARPANNIVFIVDESVRADHLSVNGYARQTTPTLDVLAKKELLKTWGAGVSGATESVSSNRLLLTGTTNLPDRENLIYTRPTIFQYARAAGYETFYFDGQDYSNWIGDDKDRAFFGRIYSNADFPAVPPHDLDRAFAEKIREIVGTSKGNFIWVNKRGVHFRYEKNYPAQAAVWLPTDKQNGQTPSESRSRLENNYDNAVLYNSESFFRALIGDAPAAETVFVYTSDHGQTLLPNRASHAGDSRAEALVPILLIGDDERLRGAENGYAAAHRNLFATLLDLMNYPKEARSHDYAPSLFKVKAGDSKPRTYFVGNLSGAFGGKQLIYDEAEPVR